MRKFIVLIFFTSIIIFQSSVFAQDNPFVSNKPVKKIEKNLKYPVFVHKFINRISTFQQKLNNKIADLTREIKENNSQRSIFIIVLISLIYGMIHALGPGHGKTITFSYFLSNRADVKKGIVVGVLIGFLHATSALLVVLSLNFIIQKSFLRSIDYLSRVMKLISYGLITLIGLFLLIKAIIEHKRRIDSKENHIDDNFANNKSIIPFVIAVGMIPCTGSLIILLFSLSMDILVMGIVSIFFMALGMATTISLVGILTIVTKMGLLKTVSKEDKVSAIFHTTLSIIGALFIVFLGTILFTGTV